MRKTTSTDTAAPYAYSDVYSKLKCVKVCASRRLVLVAVLAARLVRVLVRRLRLRGLGRRLGLDRLLGSRLGRVLAMPWLAVLSHEDGEQKSLSDVECATSRC